MKVLEIKNNLVKVSYDTDDKLVLAGFVVIEDDTTPYVGQVVSLKADNGISYAIVRLLFTFDSEGIVKNYDGSIPKLDADVTRLASGDLLEILPVQTPIKLGNLAQQDFLLNVDNSIIQNNLLVCSDSAKNSAILVSNFAKQIENNAESSIIFDIDGKYEDEKKFVFGKDFKLPLNFESINFIYGNDLNDVDATSKAVIQDIFLEVQEYTRSIPDKFIPFDTFIEVVSLQYTESEIPELALLKNKLLKYKEENVFAQSKYEIISLKEYIRDNYTTIIDISNINAKLQREVIAYIYSVLDEMNSYIYSFVKINDENSDKKLLKLFLNKNKIYTNIICNHNYKYVYELKEKVDNFILFAPETTRHDFAAYNTFLNKLNHDEFVVWGNSTQRIPLIIELTPIEIIKETPIYITDTPAPAEQEPPIPQEENEAELKVSTEETASPAEPVIDEYSTETESKSDFTENEDTYTDLSDDIERKPQEEEDYSALSPDENDIEFEEEDDFEHELDKSIESDLTSTQDDEQSVEVQENEEAPTNDFFTETEPQELTEAENEEIIIPDGEIIEEAVIEEQEEPEIALPEQNLENEILQPQIEETVESAEEPDFEEIQPEIPQEKEEAFNEPQIENGTDEQVIVEEESFIEDELKQEPLDSELQEQELNLPEPEIDERIKDDLKTIENQEPAEEQILQTEEPTPYENLLEPDSPELMPEDGDLNDELIEQVAKDIDQTFIYNKIEEEAIDEDTNADILTEDDLNFIDDINHGENEILEPVVEDSQNFEPQQQEDDDNASTDEPSQVVPIYPAKTPAATKSFEQGDHVSHPKYGEGIVEKMIKYGEKTLCSINFVNVGRRLLDPAISEISKL